MNIYDDLYLALRISQFVAFIVFIIWRYKLMPKDVERKYPFLIKLQSGIPFYFKWEGKVEKSDIPIFRKCRKADFLFYWFIGITFGIELILIFSSWPRIQLHIR